MTKTSLMAALALWAGLGSAALYAQTTTTLYGTVADKSGAVVPGAKVVAVNVGTNFTRTGRSA